MTTLKNFLAFAGKFLFIIDFYQKMLYTFFFETAFFDGRKVVDNVLIARAIFIRI